MQTFLPLEDFDESMKCLDYKRLGKQRVETWQIWLTLSTGRKSWSNHPAVKMWKGHEKWLLSYGVSCCNEWISRGYNDSLLLKFIDAFESIHDDPFPKWIGNEKFHSSHRSNLLRKDFNWYSKFGWLDDPNMGYYWPIG